MSAKTMPAKYESHCCLCDRAIRKGHSIRVRSGEPTVHATCHEVMTEGKATENSLARWTAAMARPARTAPVARPVARTWREGVQAKADRQFADFERSLGGGE